MRLIDVIYLFGFLVISLFTANATDYKVLDKIPVEVNTVGPFHNPAETYEYYTLPFCAPESFHHEDEHLGDALAGDRRHPSRYDLRFQVDNQMLTLCKITLNQNEIKQFRNAIKEHFLFELFIDDLSVKGFVGELETSTLKYGPHVHNETHFFLFTHIDFSIAYNGANVIACNMTTDPRRRKELEFGEDLDVEFSYSTKWVLTDVPWVDRMTLHSRTLIANQAIEIHWLSIVNSFVLVILLTAFAAIVLMHVLKKDFARYMELDEEDFADDGEDGGWKLVHSDVFRFPASPMLLSAFVGTGTQILVLVILILILSLVGIFYPGNRGALYTCAIFLYAFTAGIAGYESARMYISLDGTKWATNAVLTALVFAVPLFLVFCILNSIAIYYGSSTALPFQTIAIILCLWALVTFPLTILGALRGRAAAKPFDAPCKTKQAAREIPPIPWYRSAIIHLFVAGFLPFSAIYIELHYIFVSIWGHRVYTLFGILTLAFIMLLIVTAFITVTLTYFQLAAQDYHWWWRSWFSGCASGGFVYLYAIFYYYYRSQMSGWLQGAYFFGYTLVLSYAFALMLGSVSYHVASRFVIHIYRSIKVD